MLREPMKYLKNKASSDGVLWHWPEAFKDLPIANHKCSDVDLHIVHRGHSLFVEAKPMTADVPDWQRSYLMQVAAQRNHWVMLIGLRQSMNEDFNRSWSVAWWSWVNKDKWPFPRYRHVGGVAELKEEISSWCKMIDVMEDANAQYWTCKRLLVAMCKRQSEHRSNQGQLALTAS